MAHFKFSKTLGTKPQIDHDINFAKGNVLISLFPRTKLQQAAEKLTVVKKHEFRDDPRIVIPRSNATRNPYELQRFTGAHPINPRHNRDSSTSCRNDKKLCFSAAPNSCPDTSLYSRRAFRSLPGLTMRP